MDWFVMDEFLMHGNPNLRDEFAEACAQPFTTGALVQVNTQDMRRENYTELEYALSCLQPGQKIHLAMLPLPWSGPVPSDIAMAAIGAGQYPQAWLPAWTAHCCRALFNAITYIQQAGHTLHGIRLTPSIPSLIPAGAVFGYANDGADYVAQWAAAGWRPGPVNEALADFASYADSLLSGCYFSLPQFDPALGFQITPQGTIDPSIPGHIVSAVTFQAACGAVHNNTVVTMEVTWDTGPWKGWVAGILPQAPGVAIQLFADAFGEADAMPQVIAAAQSAMAAEPTPAWIEYHEWQTPAIAQALTGG